MKSISLENKEQLDQIRRHKSASVIFKHNTSCPISKTVRNSFESDMDMFPDEVNVYFLDLHNFRSLSDSTAEDFKVKHESPQLFVIREGECCFHSSHYDISAREAAEVVQS